MRRRVLVVIAGAVVAAGAAAAAVGIAVSNAQAGPEAVVADFLDAVAARDGGRAVALLDGVADADAARMRSALEGADETIADAHVREVGDGPEDASVSATFTLDGREVEVDFSALETADGWRIDDRVLGAVVVDAGAAETVDIGGANVPAREPVMLLPAVYTVTALPAELLQGSATAVALPGETADVVIEATLTAGAVDTAREQLEVYLDRCTQPAAAVPPHCGLRIPWAADLLALETLAYRVESYPELSLSGVGGSFAATGGVVVTTATGRGRDGTAASVTYRASDWSVRGDARIEDDALVLSVR